MKNNNIDDNNIVNNLSNYDISNATLADIEQMKFLEDELEICILSKQSILEDMKNKHYTYFVLKDKTKSNAIVGYVALSLVLDNMDILAIVIKKDYQKKGLASYLLKYVINFAKQNDISTILLEVRMSNVPAINLYEKFNFEKISIRKNYYTSPIEDALIYKLDI